MPSVAEIGRDGGIIASFSFRGHPRWAWAEDGRCVIIRIRQNNALNVRK